MDKKQEMEKMLGDLKKAGKLIKDYFADPAAVAVKYGLADKKENVVVKRVEGKALAPKGGCAHICAFSVEGGYEWD